MTAGELRAALSKIDDDCRVEFRIDDAFDSMRNKDGKACIVSVIDDELASVSIGYYANTGVTGSVSGLRMVRGALIPPLTRAR